MGLASTLQKLFEAATAFEKRAPQYQRIEQERAELRDALVEAGLVLSTLSESRRNGEAESRGKSEARSRRKGEAESSRTGTTEPTGNGRRARAAQQAQQKEKTPVGRKRETLARPTKQPTSSPKERA